MITKQKLFKVKAMIGAALLTLILSVSVALAQTPVIFAVAGDTGERGSGQRDVAAQMKTYRDTKGRFDAVMLLGDNVYPDGIGKGLGKHFEEPFKGLLNDGVRFYAVLGNHDIRKGVELQTNYPNFNMGGRRFYSFKMGDGLVEFFALDSTPLTEEAEKLAKQKVKNLETMKDRLERRRRALQRSGRPSATDSPAARNLERRIGQLDEVIETSNAFIDKQMNAKAEQVPWLVQALRDSTARWKVVLLHHAVYSSAYKAGGHGKDSGVKRLRKLIEPILLAGRVNVVFGGHDHVFEQVKPQGPSGGHKVYYITQGASSKLRSGDLDKKSPFYQFGEDRKRSFLVVRLSETEMNVEAVDSKGKLIRSFKIPRL